MNSGRVGSDYTFLNSLRSVPQKVGVNNL